MTVFQIISVSALGALVVFTVWKAARGHGRKRVAALWISLFALAILAILFPEKVTVMAKAMGIQRGADLVLYCAVLVGIVGFFYIIVRLRHLNRQLTLLVRGIAIDNPRIPRESEPSGRRDGADPPDGVT